METDKPKPAKKASKPRKPRRKSSTSKGNGEENKSDVGRIGDGESQHNATKMSNPEYPNNPGYNNPHYRGYGGNGVMENENMQQYNQTNGPSQYNPEMYPQNQGYGPGYNMKGNNPGMRMPYPGQTPRYQQEGPSPTLSQLLTTPARYGTQHPGYASHGGQSMDYGHSGNPGDQSAQNWGNQQVRPNQQYGGPDAQIQGDKTNVGMHASNQYPSQQPYNTPGNRGYPNMQNPHYDQTPAAGNSAYPQQYGNNMPNSGHPYGQNNPMMGPPKPGEHPSTVANPYQQQGMYYSNQPQMRGQTHPQGNVNPAYQGANVQYQQVNGPSNPQAPRPENVANVQHDPSMSAVPGTKTPDSVSGPHMQQNMVGVHMKSPGRGTPQPPQTPASGTSQRSAAPSPMAAAASPLVHPNPAVAHLRTPSAPGSPTQRNNPLSPATMRPATPGQMQQQSMPGYGHHRHQGNPQGYPQQQQQQQPGQSMPSPSMAPSPASSQRSLMSPPQPGYPQQNHFPTQNTGRPPGGSTPSKGGSQPPTPGTPHSQQAGFGMQQQNYGYGQQAMMPGGEYQNAQRRTSWQGGSQVSGQSPHPSQGSDIGDPNSLHGPYNMQQQGGPYPSTPQQQGYPQEQPGATPADRSALGRSGAAAAAAAAMAAAEHSARNGMQSKAPSGATQGAMPTPTKDPSAGQPRLPYHPNYANIQNTAGMQSHPSSAHDPYSQQQAQQYPPHQQPQYPSAGHPPYPNSGMMPGGNNQMHNPHMQRMSIQNQPHHPPPQPNYPGYPPQPQMQYPHHGMPHPGYPPHPQGKPQYDGMPPNYEERPKATASSARSASQKLTALYEPSEEPGRKEFIDNVLKYWEDKELPLKHAPLMGRKTLDLYRLYQMVKERGCMQEVTKAKGWPEICRSMGLGTSSTAGFTLKKQYCKYLYGFECRYERGEAEPPEALGRITEANRKKKQVAEQQASQMATENAGKPPTPGSQMPMGHQQGPRPPHPQQQMPYSGMQSFPGQPQHRPQMPQHSQYGGIPNQHPRFQHNSSQMQPQPYPGSYSSQQRSSMGYPPGSQPRYPAQQQYPQQHGPAPYPGQTKIQQPPSHPGQYNMPPTSEYPKPVETTEAPSTVPFTNQPYVPARNMSDNNALPVTKNETQPEQKATPNEAPQIQKPTDQANSGGDTKQGSENKAQIGSETSVVEKAAVDENSSNENKLVKPETPVSTTATSESNVHVSASNAEGAEKLAPEIPTPVIPGVTIPSTDSSDNKTAPTGTSTLLDTLPKPVTSEQTSTPGFAPTQSSQSVRPSSTPQSSMHSGMNTGSYNPSNPSAAVPNHGMARAQYPPGRTGLQSQMYGQNQDPYARPGFNANAQGYGYPRHGGPQSSGYPYPSGSSMQQMPPHSSGGMPSQQHRMPGQPDASGQYPRQQWSQAPSSGSTNYGMNHRAPYGHSYPSHSAYPGAPSSGQQYPGMKRPSPDMYQGPPNKMGRSDDGSHYMGYNYGRPPMSNNMYPRAEDPSHYHPSNMRPPTPGQRGQHQLAPGQPTSAGQGPHPYPYPHSNYQGSKHFTRPGMSPSPSGFNRPPTPNLGKRWSGGLPEGESATKRLQVLRKQSSGRVSPAQRHSPGMPRTPQPYPMQAYRSSRYPPNFRKDFASFPSFPAGSVEATQPRLVKHKKKYSKDVGVIEAWRIIMALKSGLLAESTWALNSLTILLHDSSTLNQIALSQLPGLLDAVVDHYRCCLRELFRLPGEMSLCCGFLTEHDEVEPEESTLSEEDEIIKQTLKLCKNKKGVNGLRTAFCKLPVKIVDREKPHIMDTSYLWDKPWHGTNNDDLTHIIPVFSQSSKYLNQLSRKKLDKLKQEIVENVPEVQIGPKDNEIVAVEAVLEDILSVPPYKDVPSDEENDLDHTKKPPSIKLSELSKKSDAIDKDNDSVVKPEKIDVKIEKKEDSESFATAMDISDNKEVVSTKTEKDDTKNKNDRMNEMANISENIKQEKDDKKHSEDEQKEVKMEDVTTPQLPKNLHIKSCINRLNRNCEVVLVEDETVGYPGKSTSYYSKYEYQHQSNSYPALNSVFHSERDTELQNRVLCLSNIIRSLSCISGNVQDLWKNRALMKVLAGTILLRHKHKKRCMAKDVMETEEVENIESFPVSQPKTTPEVSIKTVKDDNNLKVPRVEIEKMDAKVYEKAISASAKNSEKDDNSKNGKIVSEIPVSQQNGVSPSHSENGMETDTVECKDVIKSIDKDTKENNDPSVPPVENGEINEKKSIKLPNNINFKCKIKDLKDVIKQPIGVVATNGPEKPSESELINLQKSIIKEKNHFKKVNCVITKTCVENGVKDKECSNIKTSTIPTKKHRPGLFAPVPKTIKNLSKKPKFEDRHATLGMCVFSPETTSKEVIQEYTDPWWWDCVHTLRENTLVTIANLSPFLDVTKIPDDDVALVLLDACLHWIVCPSSEAKDPFNTVYSKSSLSPQRLVMEALTKLSIKSQNVDLILATKPFSRIEKLISILISYIGTRHHDRVMRELSIVFLSNLANGDEILSRAIVLQKGAISTLISFLEECEETGINNRRLFPGQQNQVNCGTTVYIMLRCAKIIHTLARLPENRPLFLKHQVRLLSLSMSAMLGFNVMAKIAATLFELRFT